MNNSKKTDKLCISYVNSLRFFGNRLDCSQSPIFSWDRLDIPRLTVTGILIFKCTEGAGVGDYRFGRWGGRWLFFSLPPIRPRPLSSFNTYASWQPVTESARSRWSYGKIEDCEQSRNRSKNTFRCDLNFEEITYLSSLFMAFSSSVLVFPCCRSKLSSW